MPYNTKAIVTNASALKAKYGSTYDTDLMSSINGLIAADATRGITTTYVRLDDATQMQQYGAAPVTAPTNALQNKQAIDAVYYSLGPQYLLILGSSDVVAQPLFPNPVLNSTDPQVPSDLPYACNTAYTTNPALNFFSMNRIIGRIPDVASNGQTSDDLTMLQDMFSNAVAQQKRQAVLPSIYRNSSFLLCSKEMEEITIAKLGNLFGNTPTLALSPPSGPNWSSSQYQALTHYSVCHGAINDPNWYGGPPTNPIAMSAANLLGQTLTPGTIAVAEACYGAQLYVPPSSETVNLCMAYLAMGAIAFFGSTTTSYGGLSNTPPEADYADVITLMFLEWLFSFGDSTGAAYLDARESYIIQAEDDYLPHGVLDPIDWLTFIQFNMYGDPSLKPINILHLLLEKQAERMQRPLETVYEDYHQLKKARASQMRKRLSVSTPSTDISPSAETAQAFNRLAQQANFVTPTITSYVTDAGAPDPREYYGEDVTIHIMSDTAPSGVRTLYIATEIGGRLARIKEVQAR